MTILEQAETIRTETRKARNTADRVGQCLVDIANALDSVAPQASSAGFSMQGTSITSASGTTVIPVLIDDASTTIVGGDIDVTDSGGVFYFSGLDSTHAYRVSFNISFTYDDTLEMGFSLKSSSGGDIVGANTHPLAGKGSGSEDSICITLSAMITGTTTCMLHVHPAAGSTTLAVSACDACITDLGATV